MDKFWISVAAVFVLALILVSGEISEDVFVRDLEVECEADVKEHNRVSLSGNVLTFEGAFPEQERTERLGYDFRKSGDDITLKITSEESLRSSFIDTCRKMKVYKMEKELDPGVYNVKVYHGSDRVSDQRIRVL